LLADIPRTATVTARTDVRVQALEREQFLRAVTGNDRSAAVASQLLEERGVLSPS
jgi:CRP-like cAMP-binding protein